MQNTPSIPTGRHRQLEREYAEVNNNFRAFMDIRFKLLALLPPLGGVAVFVLSMIGLSTSESVVSITDSRCLTVIVIGIFGFIASLAITIYDQRNSELYNALIHRAKYLEELFESKNSPGALREREHGGQFQERPGQHRSLFRIVPVGHDIALSLLYGSVLGAWFFPITLSLVHLFSMRSKWSLLVAASVSTCLTVAFIYELIRQDRNDKKAWNEAAKRDIPKLLAEENWKLKQLVADLTLQNNSLQNVEKHPLRKVRWWTRIKLG
jgi:hypothetical protein